MATSSNHADAQFQLAQALWQRNEVAQCEQVLRALLANAPAHEDAAMLLAELLRSQGKLDAASRTVFTLCDARGFDPATSLRGARFVQQCHRHQQAAAICDAAMARGSSGAPFLALAGHVARELGEFEKARSLFIAALEAGIDLDTDFVLGALARTQRYEDAAHPDIERFASHFADASFSPRSRASAGFALAKARDDLKQWGLAAQALDAANALARTASPWSAAAWRRFLDARKIERVTRVTGNERVEFIPVFVVGLPRTGTTLAATQLAKRTSARDRGELRVLRFIADTLIQGGHLANANALAEAARVYRTQTVQDDAPARWYIDQDPLNFRYLDIATAMFPQARVIHCRRSRRDTALSLWSQDFAHPDAGFAYDFADIASYAAGHDELMRHWKETLPTPIFELDYETLVAKPEQTVGELADFIGAPLAAATDASFENTPIDSSSVWQARQPIYSTSVGRWRAYLPYIPELAQFAE